MFLSKKILFVALLLSLLGSTAHARGADNKRWGVGVNLGEPIGLDSRFYFFKQLFGDLIVGYGFDEEAFIVQPSLDFALRDILDYDGKDFSIVPYFGAGFKTGVAKGGTGVAALRFPVGVTAVLKNGLFEISAEFAPGAEFSPRTEFDATGGVGLRYYFF